MDSKGVEKGCRWHPIIRNDNDNGVGPSEPMAENFRHAPYASLVREAIQNSLDVAKKDTSEPVEIRFSIESIDAKNFPNFFEIERHIQGCIDNFPNNEKAKKTYPPMLSYIREVNHPGKRMHYIRISDHNTQGMPYDNLGANDSPFYAFVRSAGVSSKSDESAGGSFGFGKAAYFYLSAIRTVFVSTKTEDGRYFFEGVSSLCSHKIDGKTVSNIVYYDNKNGNPTIEYDDIPIKFQRKDENGNEIGSGTDIFIMGLDFENAGLGKEGIYDEMFYAVLENFWCAVLAKKLVVKIGKRGEERTIDSTNIANLMASFYEEHDTNRRKNYNPRPYFNAVNLAGISDKFIHREINLSEVDKLKAIDSKSSWGTAHYYFAKDKQGSNRFLYMRGLRMKVRITPAVNGEGFYGVIICPDGLCNKWLRETENPAHDKWEPKRLETKESQNNASTLIKVIDEEKDKIIRDIFNLDSIETVKIKGLEQYLYIPSEADEEEEDGVSSQNGKPTGKFIDDGYSPTTDSESMRQISASSNTSLLGSVLSKRLESLSPNINGDRLTGRGDTKIKKSHTSSYISAAKPSQRNKIDEKATQSHSLEPVKVKYRSFAQVFDNDVIHKLIITSDRDIECGQIDIIIAGESSDSKMNITYSNKGKVHQNTITNLAIHKGKSQIDIRFADNLNHSIKLAVYEIK